MKYLGFIVLAYALAIGGPAVMGVAVWRRLHAARQRLLALDGRGA